jgi:alpha-tubulin suppressor-like RCC1 family protein
LKTDGTVVCWGDNTGGLLTTPSGTYRQVSVGELLACAVKTDATVVCWGTNSSPGVPSGSFRQVSVGLSSCGVRTDGTLACWGNIADAQADPAPTGTFRFVSVGYASQPAANTWDVAASGVHADDSAVAWRFERTTGGSSSTIVGLTSPAGMFKHISTYEQSCGVKTDGTVACWGDNGKGEATPPAGTFRQVSAGFQYTCGITTAGTVQCWGDNTDGKATPPPGTFW